MVVDLKIDDYSGQFVLDTGSSHTILKKSFLTSNGLDHVAKIIVSGFNAMDMFWALFSGKLAYLY